MPVYGWTAAVEIVALFVGELHRPQADFILSEVQNLNQERIASRSARCAIAAGLEAMAGAKGGICISATFAAARKLAFSLQFSWLLSRTFIAHLRWELTLRGPSFAVVRPNLNLLGTRELQHRYGSATLQDIETKLKAQCQAPWKMIPLRPRATPLLKLIARSPS